MKKFTVICIVLSCIALLLPFAAVGYMAFGLPAQYTQTFLGALSDKYERLTSVEEPKIVVIGGSSVAFGLDCAMIEEYTGMPAVNFGLYASLGTKAMLDLSKANIGEGDIVLLAPEMDKQTLSLYFNEESMWQAMDGAFGMLRYVGKANRGAMFSGVWKFAHDKYSFYTSEAPNPAGVYNRSSFNEYGDIVYKREYNIMAMGYDPTTVITLEASIVDPAFVSYVNEYIAWCRDKGAEVYFSFSPMDREALAGDTTDDSVYAFYRWLTAALDCEIISDINHCIMDWEYFYDTNFHLNDAGVKVHTAALIGDLRRAMSNTAALTLELPEKPERPDIYVDASQNDTTGFFTVEEIDGVLTLVGITEAGKAQSTLTLPLAKDGKAIQTVAENAFAGCDKLTEIIVEENSNLTLMNNGAFAGAPNLQKISLFTMPDDILVGGELMRDASADARIFVKRECYGDYAAHYFWSEYMPIISIME